MGSEKEGYRKGCLDSLPLCCKSWGLWVGKSELIRFITLKDHSDNHRWIFGAEGFRIETEGLVRSPRWEFSERCALKKEWLQEALKDKYKALKRWKIVYRVGLRPRVTQMECFRSLQGRGFLSMCIYQSSFNSHLKSIFHIMHISSQTA